MFVFYGLIGVVKIMLGSLHNKVINKEIEKGQSYSLTCRWRRRVHKEERTIAHGDSAHNFSKNHFEKWGCTKRKGTLSREGGCIVQGGKFVLGGNIIQGET